MKDTNTQPQASQNPDPKDMTAAFDQFAPALYKYALLLCHDPSLADNIVGDAFAQLLGQWKTGKDPRPRVRTYLYQAAYNSIIKNLRESPQNPSAEAVVGTSERSDITSSQSHDDQRMKEALFSALSSELTKDQRHVVILYFLEDFNIKETAKILGKNVGEIRASLKKIRKIMENHPELLTDSLAALLNKKERRRKPK
jgi:RNA polymerase sigma-70 factor (ECF subfamily)